MGSQPFPQIQIQNEDISCDQKDKASNTHKFISAINDKIVFDNFM